jgi:hypothetical protein
MAERGYDVVVVGSGGGALTAAALAAGRGLRTVVLERTALIGGTSAYSGGACWLPGTHVQRDAGLPDSTEQARTYLEAILRDPDPDLIDAFLGHAPQLVAQLDSDDLMEFEWIPFAEYYDAPGRVPMGRSIRPAGISRADLDPRVGALVRPPVELDRIGAAELQRDRMLLVAESEVALDVAVKQRRGGDHFGVEPRARGDLAQEVPAMPVGPVHHRRDAQPVGCYSHRLPSLLEPWKSPPRRKES